MLSRPLVSRSSHLLSLSASASASLVLPRVARFSSHANESNGKSKHSQGRRLFGMGLITALGAAAAGSVAVLSAASESDAKPASAVDYDSVRKSIAALLEAADYDDGSRGPLFVRLAWHASGTYSKLDQSGGSNGGCMRFNPEASWGANAGLKLARDVLEPVKRAYPGLSYADLYTLAGAVAIEEMGGPKIPWNFGRSDFPDGKSSPPDGRLPDAAQGAQHIRDIFYRMGFADKEIVALCGAHSLGRCHTDRSGFEGPWTYAPTTFSNDYFKLLLSEKWTKRNWKGPNQFENSASGADLMMLPADLALIEDKQFRQHVEFYAKNDEQFRKDFASAFGKLLELGFKTDKPAKPAEQAKPSQSVYQRVSSYIFGSKSA